MKLFNSTCRVCLFLIVGLSCSVHGAFAQSGKAKSLAIGNRWIYLHTSIDHPPEKVYEVVVKDTILAQRIYAIVEHQWISGRSRCYERADSNRIYIICSPFDSLERVLCDFSMQVGDTLNSRQSLVTEAYSTTFWGKQRRFIRYDFTSYPYPVYHNRRLYAEGIGCLNDYAWGIAIHEYGYQLLGAQLEGTMYGDTTLTVVEEMPSAGPSFFDLRQNYPNPFNPTTIIRYALPKATPTKLTIYDLLGSRVRVLVEGHETAGFKQVTWDATNDAGERVPSGVYWYRLEASEFTMTRKLSVLK